MKRTSFYTIFAACALLLAGCKGPQFETGGAYASITTTNAAGDVLAVTAPEAGLYVADAAYKLAYDTVFGVMKFERDNRAELQKISPSIKDALDDIRPKVVEIERRWALARQAYKLNPTPAGLSTVQRIIAEIQRLVPVAQAELNPVYTNLNPNSN